MQYYTSDAALSRRAETGQVATSQFIEVSSTLTCRSHQEEVKHDDLRKFWQKSVKELVPKTKKKFNHDIAALSNILFALLHSFFASIDANLREEIIC